MVLAEMLTLLSGNAPGVYNTPPYVFLFPFRTIFLAPYKTVHVPSLVGTACYICSAVFTVQQFQG
jgi:hypothetical protein